MIVLCCIILNLVSHSCLVVFIVDMLVLLICWVWAAFCVCSKMNRSSNKVYSLCLWTVTNCAALFLRFSSWQTSRSTTWWKWRVISRFCFIRLVFWTSVTKAFKWFRGNPRSVCEPSDRDTSLTPRLEWFSTWLIQILASCRKVGQSQPCCLKNRQNRCSCPCIISKWEEVNVFCVLFICIVLFTRSHLLCHYQCRKSGSPLYKHYKVYKRPQCGQCIHVITVCRLGDNGRMTYFCERCQNGDPSGVDIR